jgi:hypothetical protein
MDDLNLVLKFHLAGEVQLQIRGASRIKLDGRGGLTYYDVQSHKTERIEFDRLQSFSLLPIKAAAPNTACSLLN